MKGLVIKEPWIDLILKGTKTWEIRGSNTKIRDRIALIKSGTGLIFGTVELTDVKYLGLDEYEKGEYYHQIPDSFKITYSKIYAWVLANPIILEEPIPYKHPQGAVIWVNLDDSFDSLKN